MWEPFLLSLRAHLPQAVIMYDKRQVPVLRHANEAMDDVRRVPAFRKLGRLLTRHLDGIPSYFAVVEAISGNIRQCMLSDIDNSQ